MGERTGAGLERRRQILAALRTHQKKYGYMPGEVDLMRDLEIPRTSLRHHLDSLREQGFLQWQDGKRIHTMRLTRKRVGLQ